MVAGMLIIDTETFINNSLENYFRRTFYKNSL